MTNQPATAAGRGTERVTLLDGRRLEIDFEGRQVIVTDVGDKTIDFSWARGGTVVTVRQ